MTSEAIDVHVHEVPLGDGRFMYRVEVDGRTHDVMYTQKKGQQLTWAQRREIAQNYKEAINAQVIEEGSGTDG